MRDVTWFCDRCNRRHKFELRPALWVGALVTYGCGGQPMQRDWCDQCWQEINQLTGRKLTDE
jgi:hypothetical protein